MKTIHLIILSRFTWQTFTCGVIFLALSDSSFSATPSTNSMGKAFTSAESAAQALAGAAKNKDRSMLREVLGPSSDDLQMSDKIQGDQELTAFSTAFDSSHRIVRDSDTSATLEVGADNWPLPVPIVQKGGEWFFDTDAGKEEIINRRIGRNELSALATMRAYADAQREYASRDRDNDQVLEYAQKILSTSGKRDGLYWPTDTDGQMSPLGPMVADAQGEGYMKISSGDQSGRRPFHGYYYKILTRQGSHAPGGKYDYVINGNMIGGFAMVAWPADYGDSGIMSFVINQQGRVYQKDLGPSTASIAQKMEAYDPDSSWTLSRE